MRVKLNLATRPHIDFAPYYQRLRVWMLVLALLAIPLWLLLRAESHRAAAARAEEDQLLVSIKKLRQDQQLSQAQMRQPENAAVLTQAEFLNQIFKQKAFSWTAVMMDLENVLPSGVQVTAIEPVVAKDGHVTIRMRVSGARDRAVTLVRNLERSRHFLAPRLAGETAETGNQQGGSPFMRPVSASSDVAFEVLADYNPVHATETAAEAASQGKPAKSAAKGAATKPGGKAHLKTPPGMPAPGGVR